MMSLYIKAGDGIKAGYGIKAGESIICKKVLSFSYQLFAGVCTWRELKDGDKLVQCGKLETDGKIVLGDLKETGMEEEKKEDTKTPKKTIVVDGYRYDLEK